MDAEDGRLKEPKVVAWHHELSEYELQRLQFFQLSGRINETLIEVFDFWTDLVFVATLYVFSQPGNPVDSFLGFLASTANVHVEGERDTEFFWRLFIVGAAIMILNAFARLVVALRRLKLSKYFNSKRDWLWYFFGVAVCQVEPHNGILLIESIVRHDIPRQSDYVSTVTEIKMNLLLLCLEDLPQFVIQVIFGVYVSNGFLTVSWYVSTLVTVLKIMSSLGGVFILIYKLPYLRSLSEKTTVVAVLEE